MIHFNQLKALNMKRYIFTTILILGLANLFAQSGAVDTTFGGTGQVFTTINNSGTANGVAMQSDGKIVAAGAATLASGNAFAAVRYTSGGYLDGTFGSYGIFSAIIGSSSSANCIAIQSDGKIVLAGRAVSQSNNYDFALVRLNTDGSFDSTFGTGGIVITNLGADDEATAISIQTDGKLVVSGFSQNGSTSFSVALVRYNTDGSEDSGFGVSGAVLSAIGYNAENTPPLRKVDCKIQADGKIVLVTTVYNQTSNDILVMRYTNAGVADNTFGANGQAETDFGGNNDYGYSVYIQPDGKIIAGGGTVTPAGNLAYMALARYNTDGSSDLSFGDSGQVAAIPAIGGSVDARSLAMQANGNIIAGGTELSASLIATQEFVVAKYNANGILNDSFAGTGYMNTTLTNTGLNGNSVVMQADGKIIVAGGNGSDFILTRLLNYADVDTVASVDTTSQVDTTGHVDTTSTAILDNSFTATDLTVYPNPSHNQVTVQYNLLNDDNVTIQLWEVSGQMVTTITDGAARPAGAQKESIDVASLETGYYLLTLTTASGGELTVKLLKQ